MNYNNDNNIIDCQSSCATVTFMKKMLLFAFHRKMVRLEFMELELLSVFIP